MPIFPYEFMENSHGLVTLEGRRGEITKNQLDREPQSINPIAGWGQTGLYHYHQIYK